MFNYNKALRRLKDFDTIYDYCDCKDKYAEFIYEPHGHVHTGQLSIIKNTDLRQVMSKGAKFRVTPSVQKAKIISTIKDSILKLKRKYASKCRIKEVCFDLWFDRILQCVDNCSKSINNLHLESNDIFNLPEVVEYVHTLHNRFVIVPVDKASNNFAIICKTFYFSVLMKELGIESYNSILGNDVYKLVDISPTLFYKQQALANKALGNILEEENRNIPLLYWTSSSIKILISIVS